MENRRKYGNREIVRLIVGEVGVVFEVHLGTLCKVSAYFTAAFSKYRFAESHSREIVINEDPDTVDLFIEWAYSSSLNEDFKKETEINTCAMELAKLYIFANKYLVTGLEIQLVPLLQELSEKCSEAPQFALVEYIYQNRGSGDCCHMAHPKERSDESDRKDERGTACASRMFGRFSHRTSCQIVVSRSVQSR